MRFKFEGIEKAENDFNIYIEKLSDLSDFYKEKVRPIIIAEAKRAFNTKGYGSWAPRRDTLPHPLLKKTRKLYNSWTKPNAPGNISIYGKKRMTWGSNVFYGKFHEYGTLSIIHLRSMPARPIAKKIIEVKGARLASRISISLRRYMGLQE